MRTESLRMKMERFGRDGWFFLSSDEIPGLCLFGPDEQDLICRAEIAITELLQERGNKVVSAKIEAVPLASGRDWAAPVQHIAELIPA